MMPRVASAGTRTSRPGERPIGVFDSGVGGLTVLHELLVQLPHEDYVYLGDTARFPYGERSPDELERFSVEIAVELLRRGTKLIVVACNSATAAALPALRRRMMETTLGVEVLGVVRPEAFQAVAATRNGRIGLLATPTTVASGAYAEAVGTIDPYVTLHSVPCAALAGIIQAGEQFDARSTETVRSACAPLGEARVDTVILGCTHYPLISPLLQRLLGPAVALDGRPGRRLADGGVRHAAGVDGGAPPARRHARAPRRPHGRDPAPGRAQPACRRRLRRAGRTHRVSGLRRAAGRRRHALCVDHRRLRRSVAGMRGHRGRRTAGALAPDGLRGGSLVRERRWHGAARPRLRRGLERRGGRERRDERRGWPDRGAGDGRANAAFARALG